MLIIVNLTIFRYICLIISCLIQARMQSQNSKMEGIWVNILEKIKKDGLLFDGAMGSLGDMLQPLGPIAFDEAVDCFIEQADILEDEGVDAFLIETIFDINIALAAIRAIQSVSNKPIFCSLTFKAMKKGFFTIFGNNPVDSMKSLVDAGVSPEYIKKIREIIF